MRQFPHVVLKVASSFIRPCMLSYDTKANLSEAMTCQEKLAKVVVRQAKQDGDFCPHNKCFGFIVSTRA